MSILEKWAVKKIDKIYKKQSTSSRYSSIKELFESKKLLYFSVVAFFIGFVLTIPIIFIELEFHIFSFEDIHIANIIIYVVVLLILVILEFYLLFLLSFYVLAYYFYHLYHIDNQKNFMNETNFVAMLSRTTMELSERYEESFNIEQHELSNKDILGLTFIYKVKVVVTNFFLKFITKKVFTRTSLRVYTPYIAAVGTGFWDAIVFYRLMRHAQYKIMVRYSMVYLIEKKMTLLSAENNIKIILLRYHYYGEYNNNFEYLLNAIYDSNPFDYTKEEFLDSSVYDQCTTKLLLLLFAYKEKIHTAKERKIIKKIDQKERIKSLRKALKSGDIDYLQAYIDEL